MNNFGVLTLIPTPISEEGVLEPVAFGLLENAALKASETSVFVIEDLKPGRKRWLSFKLPRATVDHFVLYNEHTASEASKVLLAELKAGKNVFLMSDGGLPAFYDPGIELVALCHLQKIKVTSTPFCNSVVLALALSGFKHRKFWFEGFLPMDSAERVAVLKKCIALKDTSILMDTPYRLKRVLEELRDVWSSNKKIFLAMDLNSETEELMMGSPSSLLSSLSDLKREFILILS
jgi:16S rRNA (cytidine1402-2'-O)-methyltransferase